MNILKQFLKYFDTLATVMKIDILAAHSTVFGFDFLSSYQTDGLLTMLSARQLLYQTHR